MIPYKQLTLQEVFEDCQEKLSDDKPAFLSLLEQHINLYEIVPASFFEKYYSRWGRNRKYPLISMLWALILQRIFSIPSDSLLLVFLNYSQPLRDFCGFASVPHASRITHFKQDFLPELQELFEHLVDVTEPICQKLDSAKADMCIFDTSGIEAYVTENNPKYANRIIKQLKSYAKSMNFDDRFDPYKATYASMPSHAASNSDIKQLYINGHFCYAYKFGIVSNALGIIRNISFYNKDFFNAHPEIIVGKKSKSPDEDKSVHDSRLLIPTLSDFFKKHPLINPKVFLGDSAFDSIQVYKDLLTGDTFGSNRHFSKAYIPLNKRTSLKNADCLINEAGIPCCPHDSSLPMRQEGNTSHLRCSIPTFKFVCPKMKWSRCEDGKSRRVCFCDNPCTDSKSGRMVYVYPEKNLRAYPGTVRNTEEWNKVYKLRPVIEQSINHFKDSMCIAGRKTQNEKTIHADILLSAITQLVSVILADKIHRHDCIRSIKRLVA